MAKQTLLRDEIKALAYRNWQGRIENGDDGDAESDWYAAEQELRGEEPAEGDDDVPVRTGLDPK